MKTRVLQYRDVLALKNIAPMVFGVRAAVRLNSWQVLPNIVDAVSVGSVILRVKKMRGVDRW